MDFDVYCAFCRNHACHYFHTLDNTLWAVCDAHTFPFWKIAVWLDPNKYDLDSYFEAFAIPAEG